MAGDSPNRFSDPPKRYFIALVPVTSDLGATKRMRGVGAS